MTKRVKTDKNGIVELVGSEGWRSAYDLGERLEAAFPGQAGYDLASAIEYNPSDDIARFTGVAALKCWQHGEGDGDSWIWSVVFNDGSHWTATGWCDYTGWDCRSGLTWELDVSPDQIADIAESLVKLHSDLRRSGD